MPQLKVDYIVSFSSEHPEHPANNLLVKDVGNKRWLSLGKGDASNSVVLQLEKSTQITSIHIGNYHSALVEVLVGRSEAPNQQYEVLLCTSSFMTPGDSRNSVNISNVRTFMTDQLVKSTQAKKWDRIRIVCSQPYNKHVQYGLSFIHFFNSDTSPTNLSQNLQSSESNMIGRFKLKEDMDSDDFGISFKPGELFAKAKQNVSLSADAQIRQAGSSQNLKNNPFSTLLVKSSRPTTSKNSSASNNTSKDTETLSRKRDKLIYLDDDDDYNIKIDSVIQRDKEEKSKLIESQTKKSESNSKNSINQNLNTTNIKDVSKQSIIDDKSVSKISSHTNNSKKNLAATNNNNDASKKRSSSPSNIPTSSKKIRTDVDASPKTLNIKRGSDCLRGVIFVLSGYVNPKRGSLRDIAISLGAQYRPDWNQTCTHLICAFPNTPKHDQVRRAGRNSVVVTGHWIEECGKEMAHLPWKWYATDPKERIPRPKIDLSKSIDDKKIDENLNKTVITEKVVEDNDETDMEEDTDDEIERIMKRQAESNNKKMEATKDIINKILMSDDSNMAESDLDDKEYIKKPAIDPYDVDTESEIESKSNADEEIFEISTECGLLDFFSGIKFYIDPKLSDENISDYQLKRYILAYSGDLVHKWPDPQIDVAITTRNLVDNLKINKTKKCKFLCPEWIWKCNDKKTLYAFDKYVIY